MADTMPGGPHPTGNDTGVTPGLSQRHRSDSGVVARGWFQYLQALEDAIAYRRARTTAPCADCRASGRRCDDHACDLQLITAYQQRAMAAIGDVSARVHATLAGHDHEGFPVTCVRESSVIMERGRRDGPQ